jgi:hypothetical protein
MELLELLVALPEMCGCFLEFAALFSNGATAVTGVQAYRQRKKTKQSNLQEDSTRSSTLVWRFCIFLIIGLGILVLVIARWAAP